MTRNKLGDLNNHLFEQLERLGNEDLTGEALTAEIERARAISSVAGQIISNGSLALKAQAFKVEHGDPGRALTSGKAQ